MKAAGISVKNSFWLRTGTPCSGSCISRTRFSNWNKKTWCIFSRKFLVKQHSFQVICNLRYFISQHDEAEIELRWCGACSKITIILLSSENNILHGAENIGKFLLLHSPLKCLYRKCHKWERRRLCYGLYKYIERKVFFKAAKVQSIS